MFTFALLFPLATSVAFANYRDSQRWFNSQPELGRKEIQKRLVFSGHYRGFIDGRFGQQTFSAITEFEKTYGFVADGVITQRELTQLNEVYNGRFDLFGFQDVFDAKTGFMGPLPKKILSEFSEADNGIAYYSADKSINFNTLIFDASKTTLEQAFYSMVLIKNPNKVEYSKLNDDFFVITGEDEDAKYYILMERNGIYHSGFVINWINVPDNVINPIISYTGSASRYVAPQIKPDFSRPNEVPNNTIGTPSGSGASNQENAQSRPDDDASTRGSSGSGFFVSTNGLVLTNAHVVGGCKTINVVGYGAAEILRFNRELDLAVVLVKPNGKAITTAIFSDGASPLGASLIAGGFPLSTLMNNDFTVVFGKVTGRRGIGGNSNLFSISLPVQPGNSGGPLVNAEGKVAGVIVGKLDDGIMLEAVGSTGANFSFAISGLIAREFIAPFQIQSNNDLMKRPADQRLTDEEIVRNIEQYAVQILCE
ncbi:serine protease [Hoeflea alexandrii]|uniref:Peptidoglycan binding-like domain-containing protein n=1 Tax=Hoeflea alexandrii TaxID=288436 RepID=A0ABT1CSZ7_9HYPH|nr:serine protease [Hoeflea alexandrii]MCO6409043.1 hypothetical protein [Hoeflea alexandrii]MCY0151656.1 serine protease [Hoeflea alexandrii]